MFFQRRQIPLACRTYTRNYPIAPRLRPGTLSCTELLTKTRRVVRATTVVYIAIMYLLLMKYFLGKNSDRYLNVVTPTLNDLFIHLSI